MPRVFKSLHHSIVIAILLCLHGAWPKQALAQKFLAGSIYSEDSTEIPYASVFLINQGKGAASDSLGKFEIRLEKPFLAFDTLLVSSLGYESKKIPIWLNGNKTLGVYLQRASYLLKEVEVIPEKYSAKQLVKMAIKKTAKNYRRQSDAQAGFYREILFENSVPLKINECAFSYASQGYPQGRFNKKAFRYYWDDYFASSKYKVSKNISSFAQNWPVFTQVKDQVTLESSRVSINSGSLDGAISEYGDPLGGPKDILNLDFVKYRLSFFDPKLEELYEYKLLGYEETEDGRSLYVIQYAPSVQLKCYQHNWSKKIKVPLYEGRIWMSREDYSIVRFEAQSVDWRKAIAGCHQQYPISTYAPQQVSFSVFYKRTALGYDLDSINYTSVHHIKKGQPKVCQWIRALKLNSDEERTIEESPIHQFPLARESLRYRNVAYDSTFWKTFEGKLPYFKLGNDEKQYLEKSSSLEAQFALANQSILEIPKPNTHLDPAALFDPKHVVADTSAFYRVLLSENEYANAVFQKLGQFEREFMVENWQVLKRHPEEVKKNNFPKFKVASDSSLQVNYYERQLDSSYRKVFAISKEQGMHASRRVEQIEFSKHQVHYLISGPNDGFSLYKSRLKKGGLLVDSLPNVIDFVVINDSVLLYTLADPSGRSSKLIFRSLNDPKQDHLLIHEKDSRFEIEMEKSSSGKYVLISINSKLKNEIWVMDCSQFQLQKVFSRSLNRWNNADHFQDDYLVGFYPTLDSNFIFRYSLLDQQSEILHQTELVIDDLFQLNDRIFFSEYSPFQMSLKSFNLKNSGRVRTHQFQTPLAYIELIPPEKNQAFQVTVESLIAPPKTYSYNTTKSDFELLQQEQLGYIPYKSKLQCEVIHAKSEEGTSIPILIAYDQEAIQDSIAGLYMESYAAYGNLDYPQFESEKVVLMRKGFLIAQPILRGSGSLGRKHYIEGIQLQKKNTFDDFKTSLLFLQNKYKLNSDQIFVKGTSAGGLIMGVIANDSSLELGGIILDRPFLNLSESMKDSTRLLTTLEYEEWGNPSKQVIADYQQSYSPLQNINSDTRSNLFFRAGYYDEITPASAVLEAKIKHAQGQSSDQLILLKTEMREGHVFPYNAKALAEEYAFMRFIQSVSD